MTDAPVIDEVGEPVETRHSDHDSEIHMPPPSIAPLFVGLGVTFVLLGMVAPILGIVGLVIFAVSVQRIASRQTLEFHSVFLPQLEYRKLGMWAFLASEVMFFTTLIGAFIAFRIDNGDAFHEARQALSLPLATLGTTILIVSSFAVVMALEAFQSDDRRVAINWMLVTILFGLGFLSIQAVEWYELTREGIEAGDIFGTAFFTTTGFHGMHVLIGVVWLALLTFRATQGDYTSKHNLTIELFGLYWHFVDVVWIVLFTVIYLIG